MDQSTLALLNPLSEDDRNTARRQADQDMITALGAPPQREDFKNTTISKYPFWLTIVGGLMLFAVFAAAGNVSMFRMFKAGSDHYLLTMDGLWRSRIVGISTFVLAELMVIISTLAMNVFYDEKDRNKLLMLIPIAVGLAMAFVGNWTITRPDTIFGWLETAGPPVAFLFMGLIAERLILSVLARQQGDEAAYQAARQEYETKAANPRELSGWRTAYMKRLKEKLREVNSQGRGRTEREEIMRELTGREWVLLVQRELAEDAVWELAAAANPTMPVTTPEQEAVPLPLEQTRVPMGFGRTPQNQPANTAPKQTD